MDGYSPIHMLAANYSCEFQTFSNVDLHAWWLAREPDIKAWHDRTQAVVGFASGAAGCLRLIDGDAENGEYHGEIRSGELT